MVKRRCVFLDRDGVINAAPPPGEYILSPEAFRLLPSVVDWIRLFNAAGFLAIVITNQRCVARGLLRAEVLDEIHRRMRDGLAALGARIDDVFCCPHEEGTCACRKPGTGLIEQACGKWDIDLAASLMIGDSDRDRELAARCGMTFIHVRDGHIVEVREA